MIYIEYQHTPQELSFCIKLFFHRAIPAARFSVRFAPWKRLATRDRNLVMPFGHWWQTADPLA
jgi:hypothetical protein